MSRLDTWIEIGTIVLLIYFFVKDPVGLLYGMFVRPFVGTAREAPPRPVEAPQTDTPPTPSHAAIVGATAAPLALAAYHGLPTEDWLDRLNDQPDRVPHLAVAGPSGSGKTFLVLAALAERPGRHIVCTPKGERQDAWGGIPAHRLLVTTEQLSWAPISTAINAIYREMLRRNAENSEVDGDWITLVIDEFSTVIHKCPDACEQVLDLVTMGRSARIRVVILATETNVKAWGWEGRGEARNNVLFVACEEDTHRAWVSRWGKAAQEIDTSEVPSMVAVADLRARVWVPALPLPANQSAIRAQLGTNEQNSNGRARALEDEIKRRTWAGESTRAIREALNCDYNYVCEVARQARQERETANAA